MAERDYYGANYGQLRASGLGAGLYHLTQPYCAGHVTPQHQAYLLKVIDAYLNGQSVRDIPGGNAVSNSSIGRALAELSTYPEGLVPNMNEVLVKVSDHVARTKPYNREQVVLVAAVYDYLLQSKGAGVTIDQRQSFIDKVEYKGRGGSFPGSLRDYCSGTTSGAYYWSPNTSVTRLSGTRSFTRLAV